MDLPWSKPGQSARTLLVPLRQRGFPAKCLPAKCLIKTVVIKIACLNCTGPLLLCHLMHPVCACFLRVPAMLISLCCCNKTDSWASWWVFLLLKRNSAAKMTVDAEQETRRALFLFICPCPPFFLRCYASTLLYVVALFVFCPAWLCLMCQSACGWGSQPSPAVLFLLFPFCRQVVPPAVTVWKDCKVLFCCGFLEGQNGKFLSLPSECAHQNVPCFIFFLWVHHVLVIFYIKRKYFKIHCPVQSIRADNVQKAFANLPISIWGSKMSCFIFRLSRRSKRKK